MAFIYALIFSLFTLLPIIAFASDTQPHPTPDITPPVVNPTNHQVFKCNFPNNQIDPKFQSVIADPEWAQIVYLTRDGEVVPQIKDVWLSVEEIRSTPMAYIWKWQDKAGKPYVQIQELYTDPSRISILGHKPGTYECYHQFSANIDYYRRY